MSCLHMSSDCIFGIHGDFMPFLKCLYACGSSRVSFAIDCLGTCLILLNQTWLKEWRNCTLELIKFPFQSQMIQLAGPSITWNHMCMSMNLRNQCPRSWRSAEDSTAQMPILPGCFVTTSGTCVHSSGCHHGKRAEVQKIPVRFCECFSESGFRHLPHTTKVFLDFRDFLHQSRFCEAFSRRHHPLSQMAVKRIVKKCRHCF